MLRVLVVGVLAATVSEALLVGRHTDKVAKQKYLVNAGFRKSLLRKTHALKGSVEPEEDPEEEKVPAEEETGPAEDVPGEAPAEESDEATVEQPKDVVALSAEDDAPLSSDSSDMPAETAAPPASDSSGLPTDDGPHVEDVSGEYGGTPASNSSFVLKKKQMSKPQQSLVVLRDDPTITHSHKDGHAYDHATNDTGVSVTPSAAPLNQTGVVTDKNGKKKTTWRSPIALILGFHCRHPGCTQ